jgi:hypothetical protein
MGGKDGVENKWRHVALILHLGVEFRAAKEYSDFIPILDRRSSPRETY